MYLTGSKKLTGSQLSLPDNVILADNVNQFKNRLDKHWKMHDIVFNYRADFAETGGLAWVKGVLRSKK